MSKPNTLLRTIGIIGTGALGHHLAKMLLARPKFMIDPLCPYPKPQEPITVIGTVRNPVREKFLQHCFGPSLTLMHDNRQVAQKSDVVILSVKPGQIKDVCAEITSVLSDNTAVISAAAAVPLDRLQEWLPTTKTVVRCMPNLPCSIGSGLAVYYSKSSNAPKIMADVFTPNKVLQVSNDAGVDASTLIAGCGPAFISWYIEILKRVGSNIEPDKLNQQIIQTLLGTAALLQNYTPTQIIQAVASPKGATEATIAHLNKQEIDEQIYSALIVARDRIRAIADTL